MGDKPKPVAVFHSCQAYLRSDFSSGHHEHTRDSSNRPKNGVPSDRRLVVASGDKIAA